MSESPFPVLCLHLLCEATYSCPAMRYNDTGACLGQSGNRDKGQDYTELEASSGT